MSVFASDAVSVACHLLRCPVVSVARTSTTLDDGITTVPRHTNVNTVIIIAFGCNPYGHYIGRTLMIICGEFGSSVGNMLAIYRVVVSLV